MGSKGPFEHASGAQSSAAIEAIVDARIAAILGNSPASVPVTELIFLGGPRLAGKESGAGAGAELTLASHLQITGGALSLHAANTKTFLGYTAADIANVAAGNVAATTLQSAINELDADKVAKTGDTMTGPLVTNAGSGSGVGTAGLTLRSDDAGAIGPALVTYHNSASPAGGDVAWWLRCFGRNTTPADTLLFQQAILFDTVTAGTESSTMTYVLKVAGVNTTDFTVGGGVMLGNATSGRQGAGTLNATTIYTNGNMVADSNGIIRYRPFTFGTLPAAAGVGGGNTRISDSLAAPVYNAAAVGGGATFAKVASDGTIWRYG